MSICKLLEVSPPPPPLPSLSSPPPPNFKLISWNIYYELYKKEYTNKKIILYEIDKYINYHKSDILFTQESIWNLNDTKTDYTCIYTNYKKSSLSINFKQNTFETVDTDTNYIVRGGYNEINKSFEEIKQNKNSKFEDLTHNNIIRPIIAIRLKHKTTGQLFIFLNLWATHYYNLKKNNDYTNYLKHLQEIISKLYQEGDRIIIAGDFNEFYEKNKSKYKKLTIDVNSSKSITLFLKQDSLSCCGSTTIQNNNTFKGLITNSVNSNAHTFDLFYDSEELKSSVSVNTLNKISDHHPIVGIIELPTTTVNSGGGIKQNKYLKKNKHNNKKFKKTKKIKKQRNLKNLRNLKKTKTSKNIN